MFLFFVVRQRILVGPGLVSFGFRPRKTSSLTRQGKTTARDCRLDRIKYTHVGSRKARTMCLHQGIFSSLSLCPLLFPVENGQKQPIFFSI